MNATVVDLRYKTSEILKALDRRESVNILFHGKVRGTIRPLASRAEAQLAKHPFFGSAKKDRRPVAEIMKELRGAAFVLFDTDVLILAQRGRASAVNAILREEERAISLQTLLELLQTNRGKAEHLLIKTFLKDASFEVLPFTENIGHRAAVYMEEYGPATGLQAGDAVIAATAVENGVALMSGNAAHFRAIKELKFTAYK